MTEPASQHTSTSSQFTIKRLFWTLVVASVIFKLADMIGVTDAIGGHWELARGPHKVVLVISLILFSLIAVVYIAWIGIRLPYLIEQYFHIRKKRQLRREQYRKKYESWRQD